MGTPVQNISKKNRQFLEMSLTKYGDREQRRRIRRAIKAIVTRSENLESKDLITPTKISTSKNRLSSFSNRKNLKRLSLSCNFSTRNFSTRKSCHLNRKSSLDPSLIFSFGNPASSIFQSSADDSIYFFNLRKTRKPFFHLKMK